MNPQFKINVRGENIKKIFIPFQDSWRFKFSVIDLLTRCVRGGEGVLWIDGWNRIEGGGALVERVHIIILNKCQSSIKLLSLPLTKGWEFFLREDKEVSPPPSSLPMDLITVLSQPGGIPSKLITNTLTPLYQNVPSYIRSPPFPTFIKVQRYPSLFRHVCPA